MSGGRSNVLLSWGRFLCWLGAHKWGGMGPVQTCQREDCFIQRRV